MKIFNDAKDVNVAAVVIYGNGTDSKAYKDADFKTQFKTSELREAFIKRGVAFIGGVYYAPVNYGVKSDAGYITYVKADTSTATTAVLGTLTAAKD